MRWRPRVCACGPDARITAIDADRDILELARQRLHGNTDSPSLVPGRFDEVAFPACDAIVASLSLHHIRTGEAKRALYRRCRDGLVTGRAPRVRGLLPGDRIPRLSSLQRTAWRDHLRLTYSDAEADAFFAAWADEDVYFSLDDELAMLRSADSPASDVAGRGDGRHCRPLLSSANSQKTQNDTSGDVCRYPTVVDTPLATRCRPRLSHPSGLGVEGKRVISKTVFAAR